jgi:hypothetical protein
MAYTPQQQQQLMAATVVGGVNPANVGGMPAGLGRSNSASSAYAAARAAAVAAAARTNNGNRAWRSMLPADQAHVQALMQAGGSSFDSCADIWAGQAGNVDASLAGNPSAAGMMAQQQHKVGRSRLEQSPGASARQAAVMALQQQQQQELEQLQLWHRFQASRQVVTTMGGNSVDLAPVLTSEHLAAAMQPPSSQGMYQTCGGEVSSSINAAMAASLHGGMNGAMNGAMNGRGASGVQGRVVSGPNSGPLGVPGDYYQQQLPGAVSLQHTADGQAGAKARRDAAAAELMAMVAPSDLLSDGRGHFEVAWHTMPADATAAAGGVQVPGHAPAGSTAAAAAAAVQSHGQYAVHGTSGLKIPTMPRGGNTAAAAAVAAAGNVVGGLDAGDMADLWDVLEDYEGGDKESDALFEHLADLF